MVDKNEFIQIDSVRNNQIYDWSLSQIETVGIPEQYAHILNVVILLVLTVIAIVVIDYILRGILKSLFIKLIQKSKTTYDDFLVKNKILDHISHIIPLIIAQQFLPVVFVDYPIFMTWILKILSILILFSVMRLINGLLKTVRDILATKQSFVDKPLDSYLQVVQIVLFFVAGTIAFSILTGTSPWQFLISLGAASAILMLVFKDTILGFVASIQASANDSVRVGDWIEMTKYGADGTVLQINLNNVKIQNFDKTIVTIPTHTLLTDAFKNYRGMQQFGGRRIKRAVNIKISSIRYLSAAEIDELKKIQLLKPFIEERQKEIDEHNAKYNVDASMLVNGRRMTNVGLFRAYVTRYTQNDPNIHQDRTLMVRQMDPTEHGLPLELYMFTKGTDWEFYENAMANIFDHLFAAIKYFDLEIFELPASDDLRKVVKETDVLK